MEIVQEIRNVVVDGKYRVQFERSAIKERDGFKVEAFDDCQVVAFAQAEDLYLRAIALTESNKPKFEPKPEKGEMNKSSN